MHLIDIARLRRYLTVKHHIPGRIRVLFHPALIGMPEVKELVNSHSELPPGVHCVRVNALALSVVIEYDAQRIAPVLLEELITGDDQRVMEVLVELGENLGFKL